MHIVLQMIGLACTLLFFSACSINKKFISLVKSKQIGFISDGSYVLQDPPPGKARIYVFRDNSRIGSYVGYTLRIEYEPKLDSKVRTNY